jgi:DNA-binding beta-propeller fold protein YncE
MRRFVTLVVILMLAGAACSDSHRSGADAPRYVGPALGSITTVTLTGPNRLSADESLEDGAVAADGSLYLALTDKDRHHFIWSFRPGENPRNIADEVSILHLAPTAVAVDSSSRTVYVASGDSVFRFEDVPGEEGPASAQQVFALQDILADSRPGTRALFPQFGPPRYMAFDRRAHDLYMADLCRVVRYNVRTQLEAEVAGTTRPGCADANQADAFRPTAPATGQKATTVTIGLVSGLAVDERTGDVYVGDNDELRRVTPDGRFTRVEATEKDKAPTANFSLGHGRTLAVDATGAVLVPVNDTVLRISTDGTAHRVPAIDDGPGTHSGRPANLLQLEGENWIALDGAGNLYLGTRSVSPDREERPVRIRKVTAASPD